MAATTPVCEFGWKAPDFDLLGTDDKMHSLQNLRGESGTVVVFMCNHCPYVQRIMGRLVRVALDLEAHGVKMIGINSNDPENYPSDSFENMKLEVERSAIPFPYLFDGTQDVARQYDAKCTPDFFGLNADLELQYRGRLEAPGEPSDDPDAHRDLFLAMKQIAQTGKGPAEQIPSMGCSIKWKA